jgi:hypothetical protein
MPKYDPMPSADYLRACFDYNTETGNLYWKQRPREHFPSINAWHMWNTQNAGNRAGASTPKYHRVHLTGHLRLAHRVIWKLMTGEEPLGDLDHKDRNGLNNRWDNLRLATRREAVWNRRLPRNINPRRGVFPSGKKWRVRIRINGIQRHLGTFATIEEAAAAYEAAARKIQGEFYCPT